MADTGNCHKCDSEISVSADRCPECGYEPSDTSTAKILLYLGATVFGLLWILGTAVQYSQGLRPNWLLVAAFVFITTVSPASAYRIYRLRDAKPVDDPDDVVNPFN